MSYTYKTIRCDSRNFGSKRNTNCITYLVYHYTANKTDTAIANGNYYSHEIKPHASAHYFVDSNTVVQSVPDNIIAYSVGGNKWNDCCRTGGGKLYNICRNYNSISIELCSKNGRLTNETIENAMLLGKQLCSKYNIKKENVIRHFDVTGKYCPLYWCLTKEKDNEFIRFRDTLFEKTIIKNEVNSISKNSNKNDIKKLQHQLNTFMKDVPNWKPLVEDGVYGNGTRNGLIEFWKYLNWKVCTGWCAGGKTLKKLGII